MSSAILQRTLLEGSDDSPESTGHKPIILELRIKEEIIEKPEAALTEQDRLLIQHALQARERGMAGQYANKDHEYLGAAVITGDGEIFTGFNIQRPIPLTICGERLAMYHALTSSKQTRPKITSVAVIGDCDIPRPPCGICLRQLAKFGPDVRVLCANTRGDVIVTRVEDLLPLAFNHVELWNDLEQEHGHDQA